MMKRVMRVAALALMALLVASPGWAHPHGDDDRRPGQRATETCPWAAPDVEVSVQESDERVALVFRGGEDDVENLRTFAGWAADMHEHMRYHHREGPHGMGGRGRMGGMGSMMNELPPAEAVAQDIEGGARIVFTPEDPEDFDELRRHVRRRAQSMRQGRCPMMMQR